MLAREGQAFETLLRCDSLVGTDLMEFLKDLINYRLMTEHDIQLFRRFMDWSVGDPDGKRSINWQACENLRITRERMVNNVRRLRYRLMEDLEAIQQERRSPSLGSPVTFEGEPDPATNAVPSRPHSS